MKNEKLLLALLAAVQFTNILDFVIMMPLGPQLMPALGIVPRQFGLVISAYTFSAGATGLAAAFLDRFNRKTALLALYLGFGLGTVACALAPTYHWLVAARALTGAFGGVLGSLVLAIVGDAVPESRRGQAIGLGSPLFSEIISGTSAAIASQPTSPNPSCHDNIKATEHVRSWSKSFSRSSR
ncbi:MFS transporter [uncultured Hymenobacter sp.]|uniref:MFS transporter n=1 Tax=uncultured Hymenobacter sp. TaxID=170016 RepID=UPI0035CA8A55